VSREPPIKKRGSNSVESVRKSSEKNGERRGRKKRGFDFAYTRERTYNSA